METTMATGVRYKVVLALTMICVFAVVAEAVGGLTKTGERRLEYTERHEVLKSEGGSVSIWAESFEHIADAGRRFSAAHLTLEEDGFLLPSYSSGHHVIYVLEGSAYAGLMTPWGIPATLRRLKKGEMLVVPRGWVSWICNHHHEGGQSTHRHESEREGGQSHESEREGGQSHESETEGGQSHESEREGDQSTHRHESEREGGQTSTFKALVVTDFPAPPASEKGGKTETDGCYFLAGGSQREGEGCAGHGGVLHGFSKDVLAQVWGVDESDVEKLLHSQKGVGIVKVSKAQHPELWERFVSKLSHMEILSDAFRFVDGLAHTERHEGGHREQGSAAWFLGDFTYNVEAATPAVRNEGGEIRLVNKELLPALGKFGLSFSLAVVKLEKGAVRVPAWSVNAHLIVHVTSGSGRIQIVHPDGSNALDTDVHAGSVVVIPRFYPSVKVASKDEGLEFVGVMTSSRPFWSRLAGHNSLLSNMPEVVVKEAFNIPSDLVKQLRSRRAEYSVILPPSSSQKEQQEVWEL
ncbi:hypothetical protein CBR_g9005 [Chara braunii]|uniref:Cupin type-1 domain-containing protein n=1 Tax=Chara braunii TaxID=69332 RepID=A0A388KNF6_CHABU|nr:hypothetical protein CBR_g9005 [Chara braunii]|eukprot:GBG71589.1 hypothetical protein CBR_g9005 [Chara braunii]